MKYYCINLDSETERWKRCQKEFTFQKIEVERFSAISGHFSNVLPQGHYNCALSHFEVCRRFLATEEEYAVIFEDDVILFRGFKAKVESLTEDLVFIGRTTSHHSFTDRRPMPVLEKYNDDFLTISYPLGAFCYLISRRFASLIVELSRGYFEFYDVELGNLARKNQIPILTFREPLAYENVFNDDSKTEINSILPIHENINVSMYRVEYEIDAWKDYQPDSNDNSILIDHLLSGSHPDIPKDLIRKQAELFLQTGNLKELDPILPFKNTSFYITLTPETNRKTLNLTLDGLRYAKMTLFGEKIPVPPYSNLTPDVGSNAIKVEITDKIYFTRWTYYNRKVAFCNFWGGFTAHQIPFLKNYRIVDPLDRPDVLFVSVFGGQLPPHNAKRIVLFNGETTRYFNPESYTVVFDTVKRPTTLYCPLMAWCGEDLSQLESRRRLNVQKPKTRFCSFVVGNPHSPFRLQFFDLLSQYQRVDASGVVRNNTGKLIPGDHRSENLVNYYAEGKFVLCCENVQEPGYITEKIILAFASGSIPIYWGADNVEEIFNPKSFINLNNLENPISRIQELNENEELYSKMVVEPIWKNGIPKFATEQFFESNIFG